MRITLLLATSLLSMPSLFGCSTTSATHAPIGVIDSGPAVDAGPPTIPAGYTQVSYLSSAPIRSFAKAEQVLDPSKDYVAVILTDVGFITLDLYEADAPITVNSFVFLALNHFYEGIAFHRVIDGFMAQTGDPNSLVLPKSKWGTGGAGYQFGLEVKPELNFDAPGVLGMARTSDPNTNGSQFFITFNASANLNQHYTVWGRVTAGIEVLSRITRGEPPETPSRITAVWIAAKAK